MFLAAALSFSGIASSIILPALLQIYGRKIVFLVSNLFIVMGSVITAFALNVTFLNVGRIIQGFSYGASLISSITLAEMVHPKRRGFFITLKGIFFALGILACHGLGAILTWRQIAWLAAVTSAVSALSTVTWPESPSWLAYKERYDECTTAFEWLRGKDVEAKRDLRELVTAQKVLKELNINGNNNTLKRMFEAFRRPEFLKPLSIASLLIISMHAFGTQYLLVYILEIMTTLSGNKTKGYYYTLAFDASKILGGILSSGVVRLFKRKTIVFSAGTFICLALSCLCICNYLEGKELLFIKWLTPLFLIAHSMIFFSVYVPISNVIKGEIFPIQYKGLGMTFSGVLNAACATIGVKFTATMLSSLDTYGTFAVYLTLASACL